MQNEYEAQQFFYDFLAGSAKGVINTVWQQGVGAVLGVQGSLALNGVAAGNPRVADALDKLYNPYQYSSHNQAIFGAFAAGATEVVGAYDAGVGAIGGAGGGGGGSSRETGGSGGHPNNLDEIAEKYHDLLGVKQANHTTTAAATATINGEQRILIANSAGQLSPAQRALAQRLGHIPIGGEKYANEHAEALLFRIGEQRGYNFGRHGIGVSHRDGICIRCEQLVREREMTNHSPFSGKASGRF